MENQKQNAPFEWSQVKQTIEKMNLKEKWSKVKQTIEEMNLKEKWSKFKLFLDQIPIPKWMLVIMTSISVIVAIVSFASMSPTSESYNDIVESNQHDPSNQYDIMLDEYAMKVDRLIDLIDDARNSNDALAPLAYASKIENVAKEAEKLAKKLKAAPLNKRQKLYKEEIEAELEDALRWFQYNY